MIKKYAIFLILGPIANLLWVFWALPQINELGNPQETAQWFFVQSLFPIIFAILIFLKKKYVFWAILMYSGFIILYAIGMLGWALMGPETPISIFTECVLLMIMSFGLLFNSIKDLNILKEVKRYETQD